MAAVILDEAAPQEADAIPTDEQAMSTDELISDMAPDSTTDHSSENSQIDDDLPEKYKGKSVKEIIGMHQEAEKLIGRQGGEVGELRSIVDDYIKANLAFTAQQSQPQPEPEPEVDFFEDPKRAVSQAIETHPAVQEARQVATMSRQQSSLERIKAKHPDMQEVVGNQSFIDWVKASPIRTEIYLRADQNFDYDAADELISTYKVMNQKVAETTQVETAARQQQVRAAQTGGGSGANTGGSKRIYRRADIRKLMKENPDRYDELAPEIMLAYQEGRVR